MKKILSFLDSFFRALSILVIAIMLLISAFLIYYFISIKIYEAKGGNNIPPITFYNIISKSMYPDIDVYDVVVDKKVNSIDEIKVNDIITFISKSPQSYNYVVTHRVIDISKNEDGTALLTKGDNNKIADASLVYEDQILGKLIFTIPKLGKIQMFLGYKGGWILAALIPAMGVVVYDVVRIVKVKVIKNKNLKKVKRG